MNIVVRVHPTGRTSMTSGYVVRNGEDPGLTSYKQGATECLTWPEAQMLAQAARAKWDAWVISYEWAESDAPMEFVIEVQADGRRWYLENMTLGGSPRWFLRETPEEGTRYNPASDAGFDIRTYQRDEGDNAGSCVVRPLELSTDPRVRIRLHYADGTDRYVHRTSDGGWYASEAEGESRFSSRATAQSTWDSISWRFTTHRATIIEEGPAPRPVTPTAWDVLSSGGLDL